MKPKISVIGLGKLGSPLVAAIASRDFKVIGVDINPKFVDLINQKKANIIEPQLSEYLAKYNELISATSDFDVAVMNSDITMIIVPTPSNKKHEFSTKFVEKAAQSIGKVLKNKKTYHLVILVSTVLPLDCNKKIIPKLEKYSAKKCGQDFGFCYNPEFIALGSVIKNLLNPDFVLIGEYDKKSGDTLAKFYKNFCLNKATLTRMSIVNAEIAKISLNSYITTKISFANYLASLCELIPGANVDFVTNALGFDKRISPHYFKGGTSFGGPCFPRDTRAFIGLSKKFGLKAKIIMAVDEYNHFHNKHLIDVIIRNLSVKNRHVAILGTSFKPSTPVIEESTAISIIPELINNQIKVTVYDPLSLDETRKIFNKQINYVDSMEECLLKAGVIIIATADPIFKSINLSNFKSGVTIIDCWRILDSSKLADGINYIPLGISKDLLSC